MRPAVDEEGDGIFAAFDIAVGLGHVAVDRLAVPAGEAELLGRAERGFGEDRCARVGQLARRPRSLLHEQLLRRAEAFADEGGRSARAVEAR